MDQVRPDRNHPYNHPPPPHIQIFIEMVYCMTFSYMVCVSHVSITMLRFIKHIKFELRRCLIKWILRGMRHDMAC